MMRQRKAGKLSNFFFSYKVFRDERDKTERTRCENDVWRWIYSITRKLCMCRSPISAYFESFETPLSIYAFIAPKFRAVEENVCVMYIHEKRRSNTLHANFVTNLFYNPTNLSHYCFAFRSSDITRFFRLNLSLGCRLAFKF